LNAWSTRTGRILVVVMLSESWSGTWTVIATRVTRGLIFKLGSTLITLCGTIGSHNAWFIETERERDTETLAAFCRF
jgi:hypothetical protein